jgi:hypothetical protein
MTLPFSAARRLAALVAAAAVVVAASAPPAPAATVKTATSSNWAGYVVSGRKFSSVSGSWVVPTVNGASGGDAAFWVGLGGASSASRALEQVGTESDASSNGHTHYYAWYELVPAAPVTLNVAIHPGDSISAKVTAHVSKVTVSLKNNTTGKSVTKTLGMSRTDRTSAEWIAEAPTLVSPSGRSNVLPLADFGTVNFTGATDTTTGGHTGTIADSHWTAQQVQLSPDAAGPGRFGRRFDPAPGGIVGATTSALAGSGDAFSVTTTSATTP